MKKLLFPVAFALTPFLIPSNSLISLP